MQINQTVQAGWGVGGSRLGQVCYLQVLFALPYYLPGRAHVLCTVQVQDVCERPRNLKEGLPGNTKLMSALDSSTKRALDRKITVIYGPCLGQCVRSVEIAIVP